MKHKFFNLLMLFILLSFSACQQENVNLVISKDQKFDKSPVLASTNTVIIPTTPTPWSENLRTEPKSTTGSNFYVAVDGKRGGEGSFDDPWDLQTALDHPNVVQPGDTIWLGGGIYQGKYQSHLKGAEGNPIILRQHPSERATISGEGLMLDIQDSYWVDFWGFEITAFENKRDPVERPLWGFGVRTHQGYHSHHIRFINMVIHDVPTQGFGWWITNTDSEIYGCLIYYNGVNQLDHGIYVKNDEGIKKIRDNFIFDNASHGIHAYSSSEDTLNNILIIGNTLFNNGSTGYSLRNFQYGNYERNILVGGYNVTKSPLISENYTYYPGNQGESLNIGYRIGSLDAIVQDNYFMGGGLVIGSVAQNLVFTNNTILSSKNTTLLNNRYKGNIFYHKKPAETMIFLRQNEFEKNRSHLTIYNWQLEDNVMVSEALLSNLPLQPGDSFQLINVQDYFNDRIVGTYEGNGITVPMRGHTVAQPIGLPYAPPSSFPEFGAFLLIIDD
jgi:hypothetical protein